MQKKNAENHQTKMCGMKFSIITNGRMREKEDAKCQLYLIVHNMNEISMIHNTKHLKHYKPAYPAF